MILRPVGLVSGDELHRGLEVEVANGAVLAIRPISAASEPYVLSVAFANAHSHLEYRGLMGKVDGDRYSAWIRSITELKRTQLPEAVAEDCRLAAKENRVTGVAVIGEHSDRPGAAEAIRAEGLSGVVFHEVLTLNERDAPQAKLAAIEERKNESAALGITVGYAPHAPYTVDPGTLRWLGSRNEPLSIHVAESEDENALFRRGEGAIAAFYRSIGAEVPVSGGSAVEYLAKMGLVRRGVQFVHCCSVSASDIRLMARGGVTVAHCPRTNAALGCEDAPIREMLDAGVVVGLGLDSAASSGPIDVFAEMRAALAAAERRRKVVTAEEVWRMATVGGCASIPGLDAAPWDLRVGARAPFIRIALPGATCLRDIIEQGAPEIVDFA